ncbi:MAG: cytochrome-c peroxidase [Planctomycetota bacterium]|nr:cytochrome-c peroxidase [Planctomycetota bacterium]
MYNTKKLQFAHSTRRAGSSRLIANCRFYILITLVTFACQQTTNSPVRSDRPAHSTTASPREHRVTSASSSHARRDQRRSSAKSTVLPVNNATSRFIARVHPPNLKSPNDFAVQQAGGVISQYSHEDILLIRLLRAHNVAPIDRSPTFPDAQLRLGQALFFDPLLSGNRDVACATCHHPTLAGGDSLSLSVGTGTMTPSRIGPARISGRGRRFAPRNSPDLFNRGSRYWSSQFWDSRVAITPDGYAISPAKAQLPPGIMNLLALQAMFPVTSRDEMRGAIQDAYNPLHNNELAALGDKDWPAIWHLLMKRLLQVPGYQKLFMDAYNITLQDLHRLSFVQAANCIAAFETVAFSFDDSPFDEYMRGNLEALSNPQKRGGIVFYGKAGCGRCHSGPLLTDQQHYNLAVPHVGPGKDSKLGLDVGRYAETKDCRDLYAFRTPPLRNVTETGPWMHNGSISDLRGVVRHHLNPVRSLLTYNPESHLTQPALKHAYSAKGGVIQQMIQGVDLSPIAITRQEFDDLMQFLASLTAPNLHERLRATIPTSVPSGLPVPGLADVRRQQQEASTAK